MKTRLLALASVVALFALVLLYVREYPVFSNTIGGGRLAIRSMLVGAVIAAALLVFLRRRFTPIDQHFPEFFAILLPSILFAPLFGSLLNRAGGTVEHKSYIFVSEQPYYASPYGFFKGETVRPSGFKLQVRKEGRIYNFRYKKQAYYPLSKPGDDILLPVRQGLLGFQLVELN